jgi:hypothetical protein
VADGRDGLRPPSRRAGGFILVTGYQKR